MDAAAAHINVPVTQRRQSERTILPRVLVVADADQRLLEKLDDERQHLLALELLAPQVGVGAAADCGQRLRKTNQSVVLRFVADSAPFRVIAVLLSARASRPVACRWPFASVQIHTSSHAGGMTSDLIRASSSRLVTRRPLGAKYRNVEPCFTRRIPGRASVVYRNPAARADARQSGAIPSRIARPRPAKAGLYRAVSGDHSRPRLVASISWMTAS